MSGKFVPFDDTRRLAVEALKGVDPPAVPIHLIRNLFGKVRISVPEKAEDDEACRAGLQRLAGKLAEALGARGYPAENGVLFVSDALLETLRDTAQPVEGFDNVFWEDRLVTGNDWWTVGDLPQERRARRWTLFSVKGGVGRSTTAAVLAWHLARKGERVLVVDLDLESPGLSSAMLGPDARPEFGVVDWFVEDLVGQGDRVIADMTAAPAWAQGFEGEAIVAPAHGRDPGEYLAKVGRVYMNGKDDPWARRLDRLLQDLETRFDPTVVLIESRSGLHDIAAAAVTDIGAGTLLFATDSKSNWTDYDILFRHWRDRDLAAKIRDRLWIVSALTPPDDEHRYLERFRERAWSLFGDHLYDEVSSSAAPGEEEVFFDLRDEGAPHDPLRIYWERAFAAGAPLDRIEKAAVDLAYGAFLPRFDDLIGGSGEAR